jgi:hypothetical protein
MVAMKKKELVLAAAAMSNEEFEVLRQDRERRQQITDQESSARLVAALETSVNATTEGTEGSL